MKKLIAIGVLACGISLGFSEPLTEHIPFDVYVSHDFQVNIVDIPLKSTFICLVNIPNPSQMEGNVRVAATNIKMNQGDTGDGIMMPFEKLNSYYKKFSVSPYNTSRPMGVTFSNFRDWNKDEILHIRCYYF